MASAAAAAAAAHVTVFVKEKEGRIHIFRDVSPDEFVGSFSGRLTERRLDPRSTLYHITDAALWAAFKANPDAENVFLNGTPKPGTVDDEGPIVAGMRLLAVPPALPAVAGKSASLSRDFAPAPASRRPSLIMLLVSPRAFCFFFAAVGGAGAAGEFASRGCGAWLVDPFL